MLVPAGCVRTFLEDVDDVVGVEAELVGVLRVVGVERAALRHLRLGLGLRLGPAPGGRRAARRLPADTATHSEGCETRTSAPATPSLNGFVANNGTQKGKTRFLECHNN